MGTGIEQTYPAVHQALRQQMINHGGTVITEFLPFTPLLQQHFPRRNRIVSGLSLGVIVAEAALKSGSLLTAQWAAEQGKKIGRASCRERGKSLVVAVRCVHQEDEKTAARKAREH